MDSRYDHRKYEQEIYREWEESGMFAPPPPDEAKERGMESFTIIMPPPNANDPLHVGHAMFLTVEDIMIRYQRMQGKAALWLPGTDHAGIETQYVFEKKLQKQGKSRFNFDREALYRMIWGYVQENSGVAIEQMKRLGASADWSRTKFTLDEDCVDLTLYAFERMHEEGLVERQQALVNYCTKCGTAYSQLEINHEERNSPLYYLKYGPFELATVRPETKFGDTAVAVNPKDERYQEWIGKEIEVEGLLGKFSMKVIADEHVDPEFGTGVVKITPGHDANDFEVWQRHKGEIPGPKQVVGFDGKMTELAGKYAGLSVMEARKKVVEDLKVKDLLVRVDEEYKNSVAVCYRCGRDIEPLPMSQFFVKVESLTKMVLAALDSGETKIVGAGHDKILRHWLKNLKDWNISRQIVWGIRLPIWYRIPDRQITNAEFLISKQNPNSKHQTLNSGIVVGFLDEEGKYVSEKIGELLERYGFELIEKNLQTLVAPDDAEYVVSREKPSGEELWLQETDTFDTWFSSAQWPVNTLLAQSGGSRLESRDSKYKDLRLPYSSQDFEFFYPTSVMETGYDILPFWVMRMMIMGIYMTGHSPFRTVYLHGLVRDEKGQKMSKSKGNVINPLELLDKYGADALRMALVMSTTPGHDSAVGESKVKGMRNMANKIWNASRFIRMNRESHESRVMSHEDYNKDFNNRLSSIVIEVTEQLEALRIGQAAETVHNEFWHWFCDECIEEAKKGELSPAMLEDGLKTFLKLLHPFMPFVTETVWKELGYKGKLITARWPG